jgi:hypothetical protein
MSDDEAGRAMDDDGKHTGLRQRLQARGIKQPPLDLALVGARFLLVH